MFNLSQPAETRPSLCCAYLISAYAALIWHCPSCLQQFRIHFPQVVHILLHFHGWSSQTLCWVVGDMHHPCDCWHSLRFARNKDPYVDDARHHGGVCCIFDIWEKQPRGLPTGHPPSLWRLALLRSVSSRTTTIARMALPRPRNHDRQPSPLDTQHLHFERSVLWCQVPGMPNSKQQPTNLMPQILCFLKSSLFGHMWTLTNIPKEFCYTPTATTKG